MRLSMPSSLASRADAVLSPLITVINSLESMRRLIVDLTVRVPEMPIEPSARITVSGQSKPALINRIFAYSGHFAIQ